MKNIYLTAILTLFPVITFCTDSPESGKALFADNQKFVQDVKLPPIPKSVTFAGEEVPLQFFDVKESLQREITSLSYLHGTMIFIMQLDNRYSKEIRKILKEEGVPEDLYYICIAESMLQPLVSPAGAAGYWQFLAGTAREYGLVVDNEVDERYNIEKSTRAAAAYFKKAYAEFGSWTMAAASYNTGFKNVSYRISKQNKNCYYDTQFVEETGRYVFRAIAFKTILNNRELYGFNLKDEDLFRELEYKTVEVKGAVANWSDFAAVHGTNFKLLKMFNQWIRANNLDNKLKRTYKVRIPEKGFREAN
jgi:membrane-bound lytic murein transglycosylase D